MNDKIKLQFLGQIARREGDNLEKIISLGHKVSESIVGKSLDGVMLLNLRDHRIGCLHNFSLRSGWLEFHQNLTGSQLVSHDSQAGDTTSNHPAPLPHKVKTQYLHFRSHAEYFLLAWKIPEMISR